MDSGIKISGDTGQRPEPEPVDRIGLSVVPDSVVGMGSGAECVDGDGVVVDLAELDADAALKSLAGTCAAEKRAAAWKLRLAAHWADLHSGDALARNSTALPGTERAKRIGGDGTPLIGEFGGAEFAAVAGLARSAGDRLIADAVDLRHRFPRIWERIGRAEPDMWVCRKIATDTRHLSLEAAQKVDAAVAPYLTSLPPGRLFTLVEAKAIEAAPADYEARARLAQADRFVRPGRSNTAGVMPLSARGLTGHVLAFTAACDKIAKILAWQGDPDSADVRRSKALSYVADPVRHAELLAQYQDRDGDGDPAHHEPAVESEPEPVDEPMLIFETDLHPADLDDLAEEPTPAPEQAPTVEPDPPINYAEEFQSLLDRYGVTPRDLLPKTVIYLHVDRDTLLGGSGAIRVEQTGPITPDQFKSWIRGTHLTVTPVIDPANTPAIDGYETSERLKDALRMINPAETFPYGTYTGRTVDHDHVNRYRPPPDGPPGQTSTRTLARLIRGSHRIKTHTSWQVRMPEPGTTIWRTPHGWYFLTNPAGTHPLGNGDYARTLWNTMINDFTAVRYPITG